MSEITPETPATRLPADYYCSPVLEKDRILPRWVTIGCGTASLIILILLFAAGAFVNGGGGTRLVHAVFGRLQTELLQQCSRDVKPSQKTDFAAEFSTLQNRISAGKVKGDDMLDVFELIRDETEDTVVTPDELDRLTKKVHAINTAR